ncbi:MAG: class I SAM-dependent methyltransferase [Chloroflexi bacterium]|nr:class I SAM-dependent methyltransferase [Chloroflexota bacterium]
MPTTSDRSTFIDAQIKSLEGANPLREPILRSIVAALQFPPGSQGLDIGCGIGLQTSLLAEATSPDGCVTGLDISPELLAYAQNRVRSLVGADRITFREGDMRSLPFPDNSFDWAWSVDCVGYPAGDLLPVLKEITRVVRPGGRVAISAWTSQQLLPGYTMLEARLNATCSAYAPFFQGRSPELYYLRALRWFSEAGLMDVVARTFVSDIQAPLSIEYRTALISLFEMLWNESAAAELDRLEHRRLCRAESPDCILNLPEYYAFFTYSMFSGRVSK